MKAVLQRVSSASVVVDGEIRASLPDGRMGLLVLAGLEETDTREDMQWMAEKIVHLRIFADDAGKMNVSVIDKRGAIIVVPNFTLAGDAVKGRRPSFDRAMRPERSETEFHEFVRMIGAAVPDVQAGVFRTHMHVSLVNDGPVTILLDSRLRTSSSV